MKNDNESSNDLWHSDGFNGPYECMVAYDKSVKDNCSAGLNNAKALNPLSVGDNVKVRVQHAGDTVEYKTHVKEPGDYLTLPIAQRRRLGVQPRDIVRFWVKRTDTEQGTKIAIKPKSGVYHIVKNGTIPCNHAGATKPGTSSNGFLTATLEDVSDEWRPCSVCKSMKASADASYTDLISEIQSLIGTERDTDTLNKHELTLILTELTGEDITEVISE